MSAPVRIALFDYGSGNLHSVSRALIEAGASVVVTSSIHEAAECDGIVIPGVGAFSSCMAGLRAARGDELIALAVAREQPLFGICVGHQILFASGSEHGEQTPVSMFIPDESSGCDHLACHTWDGIECGFPHRAAC